MNAFRRVILVFYSLLLLAAVGGVGSLAWNQDEKLDLEINDLNIQAFVDAGDGAKWALTGVLAGLGLLAIITLMIAIWPKRSAYRSKDTLRIRQSDGGTVEVTAGAIESLLRQELEALPEVRTALPRVRLSGGAVDTHLDAKIEPSVSIAEATKLLSGTVDQVLRELVGVTAIRRPIIRITYDEMNARPTGSLRRTEPLNPAVFPNDDPPRSMSPDTQMKPPVAVESSRPPEAPSYTYPTEESTNDDRS